MNRAPVRSGLSRFCTQHQPGSQTMFLTAWRRWLRSLRTSLSGNPRRRKTTRPVRLECEALEDRAMLSTFTVVNANDSGAGSLRQAIVNANANSGADLIQFNIPGAGVH